MVHVEKNKFNDVDIIYFFQPSDYLKYFKLLTPDLIYC